MAPPLPSAAVLAEHGEFLRRLAAGLVGEEADDVVQQTGLVAMQRGPREAGRLGPWLRAVARNGALQLRRERARRRRHEGAAARADATGSTVDAVARHEIVRLVAEAVARLREPFRTAVLLRYYEGLPPRVIAAREGVPVATINSRVHRGLAQLRDELDRRSQGARDWRAALLPLLGGEAGAAAVPSAAVGSKSIQFFVCLVGLPLVAAPIVWWASRDPNVETTGGSGERAPMTVAAGRDVTTPTPAPKLQRRSAPSQAVAGLPASQVVWVSGRVLDMRGRPVAAAIWCSGFAGTGMRRQGEADADGRFTVRLDSQGGFSPHLLATAAGFAPSMAVLVPIVPPPPLRPGEVATPLPDQHASVDLTFASHGLDLFGRVTDAVGRPLAEADVVVGHDRDASPLAENNVSAPRSERLTTDTDASGGYRLPGAAADWCVVAVECAGYAPARRTVSGGGGSRQQVDFVLDIGFELTGVVSDELGRPIEGALVSSGGEGALGQVAAHSDELGRYRLGPLPVGRRECAVQAADGRRARFVANGGAGQVVDWSPRLAAGRVLRGVVREAGVAVSSGVYSVWAFGSDGELIGDTATDDSGCFAVPQCPQRVRVEVRDGSGLDSLPLLVRDLEVGDDAVLVVDRHAVGELHGSVALPGELATANIEMRLQRLVAGGVSPVGEDISPGAGDLFVAPVPAGSYRIVLHGGRWGWASLLEVTIGAGERVDIGQLILPEPGVLSLPPPVAAAVIERWSLECSEGVVVRAGHGVLPAEISLAPGSFRLRVERAGAEPRTYPFAITSGREVTIAVGG